MITIKNDYHNTTVRIRATIGTVLTPVQANRVRRVLCGSPDCKCGAVRGGQALDNGARIDVAEAWHGPSQTWTYEITG